jgi:hypothetical protein
MVIGWSYQKMSKNDFDLFIEALKLWEKKLVFPEEKTIFQEAVMRKIKDPGKMVNVVKSDTDQSGVKYYRTEEGLGIWPPGTIPQTI